MAMSAGATTLLQTTTNALDQPIEYPQEGAAEVTALRIEMQPGETTPWHQHPVPLLGYILSGELTVHLADGRKRVVRTGEVSLESVGLAHRGANEGAVAVTMIVFVLGRKGEPFVVDDEGPASA